MPSHTSTTYVSTYYEEPTVGTSSGTAFVNVDDVRRRQRRHSSYNRCRSHSVDLGNVQLRVDGFLADLGKRLEMMECYGHLKIDEGLQAAHDTLLAVHESCGNVADDIIDAGRRRAKVLVETLEGSYHDALAKKGTLESKVLEGVRIMEAVCEDLERRAYDIRQAGLAATAHDVLDTGIAYVEDASNRATERLRQTIDEAIQRARTHGLISYEHLPTPWMNNPHIIKGYRFSETWHDCVRSCFTTFSNETFNIYSHFVGLVVVLALAFFIYPSTPAFNEASNVDIFVAGCFFFAACKCLCCSILWHTMSSISDQSTMECFACVDFTGISLLVAASIMTTEYTAFYCEPWPRWIYMTTTFVLGAVGSVLPWHPTFSSPEKSWARVAFYVGLAATGFLPILQLTFERGWQSALYFYAPITKSILVYLVGAVLYAAKIPEIWHPGLFDYLGASHNLWHLAVLGGIIWHYSAMQAFFVEAFARRASVEFCSHL